MQQSEQTFSTVPIQFYIEAFKKYPSVWLLALSNAIPLIGVIFFKWSIGEIFFTYWLELFVMQLFVAVKIYFAEGDLEYTKNNRHQKIPQIIHYGIFALFIAYIYQGAMYNFYDSNIITFETNHLITIGSLFLSIVITHTYSFFKNYLGKEEYLKTTVNELRTNAFQRIYILHMALWAGGIIGIYIKGGMSYVLTLVILKTAFDIYLHVKEHNKFMIPTLH